MKLTALALSLPSLVLLGWCGLLEWTLTSGREVRLAIQGYDPRDLLSGHYVQYSLAFNDVQPCASGERDTEVCVALSPMHTKPEYYVGVWSGSCGEIPPHTSIFIRGRCSWSRFSAGVERYFIPESLAPALAQIPENSSVVLRVRRDGSAQVARVLVEDTTIEEYAKRALQEKRKSL